MTIEQLFELLHYYDDTWAIVRESDTAVLLENAQGTQIHAASLELALFSALTTIQVYDEAHDTLIVFVVEEDVIDLPSILDIGDEE